MATAFTAEAIVGGLLVIVPFAVHWRDTSVRTSANLHADKTCNA